MTKKKSWTNEEFVEAVKRSFSVAEVFRSFGLKGTSANYRTFKIYKKMLNLDISHLTQKHILKLKVLKEFH